MISIDWVRAHFRHLDKTSNARVHCLRKEKKRKEKKRKPKVENKVEERKSSKR